MSHNEQPANAFSVTENKTVVAHGRTICCNSFFHSTSQDKRVRRETLQRNMNAEKYRERKKERERERQQRFIYRTCNWRLIYQFAIFYLLKKKKEKTIDTQPGTNHEFSFRSWFSFNFLPFDFLRIASHESISNLYLFVTKVSKFVLIVLIFVIALRTWGSCFISNCSRTNPFLYTFLCLMLHSMNIIWYQRYPSRFHVGSYSIYIHLWTMNSCQINRYIVVEKNWQNNMDRASVSVIRCTVFKNERVYKTVRWHGFPREDYENCNWVFLVKIMGSVLALHTTISRVAVLRRAYAKFRRPTKKSTFLFSRFHPLSWPNARPSREKELNFKYRSNAVFLFFFTIILNTF